MNKDNMKEYVVEIPIRGLKYVSIFAESKRDAIAKVENGLGEDLDTRVEQCGKPRNAIEMD